MFSKKIALLSAGLPLIQAAVPEVPGFSLTWSEEFIGSVNSLPNLANWIVNTGTSYSGGAPQWGTWEVETYTSRPENLRLTGDGKLAITPLRDEAGKWTSGKIETQRTDFQAKPGGKMRIAASISLPDVSGPAAYGYWPAFWTLGDTFRKNVTDWPRAGEYDIMENVNGKNAVWGTLHCGVWGGGPCHETDGISGSHESCPGSACEGNFHTYALIVDRSSSPEKIVWSVDGLEYHSVRSTDLPADVWEQTVHHGHFILLNVAMGGAFPDKNLPGTTPQASTVPGKTMYADWVAVWNSS